ncbi:MAG: tetratricopeptide repeat protein [Planctomycetota bacterium]
MSFQRRIHPVDRGDHEVFFLPLALPEPRRFQLPDAGVISRRVPDFLHQMINNGEPGPIGMLEIQTAPAPGAQVDWMLLDKSPNADEAFAMMPPNNDIRAVVSGTLRTGHDGLEVEVCVHLRQDHDANRTVTLRMDVDARDPVPTLSKLASRLAKILEIPYQKPPPGLLTNSSHAFYKFLEGLDGSVLLSGDLQVPAMADPETLMRPYVDALVLDPGFGLALRIAHVSLVAAVDRAQMTTASFRRIIDGCLNARPLDGDACVQVAAYLHQLGDEERARVWLEHAVGLPSPPPRALEVLGILLSKHGKHDEARALWLRGAELDGHPDFCAHLARFAFDDGDVDEAWEQTNCGLRRILERRSRPDEWPEDGHGVELLLQCVAEKVQTYAPPEQVVEALHDLRGLLPQPEERIELGLCLMEIGLLGDARTEIQAALSLDLELPVRDKAVRAMLTLDVPDFELRFMRAAKAIKKGQSPGRGMRVMREFLIRQPEFWLALFHVAIGLRRQGHDDEALDALAEVLQMHPGQVETLVEMAELFAARGNPKRALECVDEALLTRSDEALLHLRRAEYLEQLDRPAAAGSAVKKALALEQD